MSFTIPMHIRGDGNLDRSSDRSVSGRWGHPECKSWRVDRGSWTLFLDRGDAMLVGMAISGVPACPRQQQQRHRRQRIVPLSASACRIAGPFWRRPPAAATPLCFFVACLFVIMPHRAAASHPHRKARGIMVAASSSQHGRVMCVQTRAPDARASVFHQRFFAPSRASNAAAGLSTPPQFDFSFGLQSCCA